MSGHKWSSFLSLSLYREQSEQNLAWNCFVIDLLSRRRKWFFGCSRCLALKAGAWQEHTVTLWHHLMTAKSLDQLAYWERKQATKYSAPVPAARSEASWSIRACCFHRFPEFLSFSIWIFLFEPKIGPLFEIEISILEIESYEWTRQTMAVQTCLFNLAFGASIQCLALANSLPAARSGTKSAKCNLHCKRSAKRKSDYLLRGISVFVCWNGRADCGEVFVVFFGSHSRSVYLTNCIGQIMLKWRTMFLTRIKRS